MLAQQKHTLRATLTIEGCGLLICDAIITCHVRKAKYMQNIVALRIATMHLSQMGLLGYHGKTNQMTCKQALDWLWYRDHSAIRRVGPYFSLWMIGILKGCYYYYSQFMQEYRSRNTAYFDDPGHTQEQT